MNSLHAGVFVGLYAAKHPPSQRYGAAGEFRSSKMTLEFSSQFFFRAHSRNPRRRVAAAEFFYRRQRRKRRYETPGPRGKLPRRFLLFCSLQAESFEKCRSSEPVREN